MGNVKRVSFMYVNGDKKRKEYHDVNVSIEKGCLCIGGVKGQPKNGFLFPLSTITCIKLEPHDEEEETE